MKKNLLQLSSFSFIGMIDHTRKLFQIVMLVFVLLCSLNRANAATYLVTNTNDSGAGSLRQAILDANANSGSDIIDATGVTGTITLTTGQLSITDGVTISGPGANLLSVSGNNSSRVFQISGGVTVNINNLTITGGNVSDNGGGIFVNGGILNLNNSAVSNNSANSGAGISILPYNLIGSVNITNSTISGNTANVGGGIFTGSDGTACCTLTITNSTISGNSAGSGGGIATYCPGFGQTTLTNCTLSGNTATSSGGGIFNQASVTLINTIVANSTLGGDIVNVGGTTNAQNSLIGDGLIGINGTSSNNLTGNPLLGPLANNGGPTPTMALLSGSPAIDQGSTVTGITTDQRGIIRPYDNPSIANASGGNGSDIGAFELQCIYNPVVTNSNDTGAGSLRQAVLDACSGSTITFDMTQVTSPISISTYILINKNLIIQGPGANVLTIKNTGPNNDSRSYDFNISPAVNVTISGLTLSGGNTTFTNYNNGGAISNSGNLTVDRCTISNNSAWWCGGILSYSGTVYITNSTITGNNATGYNSGGLEVNGGTVNVINSTISGNTGKSGGGIQVQNGTLNITNSTISNNTAPSGGGIIWFNGTINVKNSIIAGNIVTTTGPDYFGTVISQGNNLIGKTDGSSGWVASDLTGTIAAPLNPLIATLANNGGTTYTQALLPGSPAINAGTNTGAPATDQRNIARILPTDIGAFESQGFTMAISGGNNQSTTIGTSFANPLSVTVASAFSEPVDGGQVLFTPPASGASSMILGNPATISGGIATTGTITANLTGGGPYTVTVSANGVPTPVNFSLTNSDPCSNFSNNRAYVNASATGANNGGNWSDAFTSLQSALAVTGTCGITEIWVAKGTYYPDEGTGQTDNNVNSTFALINGVAIYGGFVGTETTLGDRNWRTNVTILSGDIDKDNNIANNAYHVTTGSGTNNTAVLDGFTVIGGNSICTVSCGAGGQSGGGMLNISGSPTVSNCIFTGNIAAQFGGGMANITSSPTITNCTFSGNSYSQVIVESNAGGGMYNEGSSPSMVNCIFSGNSAVTVGGGMYNTKTVVGIHTFIYSFPSITNCTFSGNSAYFPSSSSAGGGIGNDSGSSSTLINCILWNNRDNSGTGTLSSSIYGTSVITYSLVQGQNPAGTGNLDGTNPANNPLFVTAVDPTTAPTAAGDLHLQTGSPAINSGTNTSAPSADIEGNPRPLTVANPADMGAYEYQSTCVTNPVVTNNSNAGPGSLRQAVIDACPGSTITFANSVASPISLSGGQIIIDKNLTIQGPGVNLLTVQNTESSSAKSRVFYINSSVTATISDLTISGGNIIFANPGGGICNFGNLTVNNSTISNNSTNDGGGGIYSAGTLMVVNTSVSGNYANAGGTGGGILIDSGTATISNSTITGNDAIGQGGGIRNNGTLTVINSTIFGNGGTLVSTGGGIYNGGTLTVSSTTISGNSAFVAGGGIYNSNPVSPGSLTKLGNSIVALNTAQYGPDIFGSGELILTHNDLIGTSSAFVLASPTNLIGLNPMLGPLQNNGGPTKTMALNTASPAINAAASIDSYLGYTLMTDQRGLARPNLGSYDIGAFELQCISNPVVVNNSDAGPGSLRQAVFEACPGSIITFDMSQVVSPILLSGGQIIIDKNLTIQGPGANTLTVQNTAAASTTSRIFYVNVGVTSTISGLTITGGNTASTGFVEASGGGIYNNGSLTLLNNVMKDNTSSYGGGAIFNYGGNLTVNSCTITGSVNAIRTYAGVSSLPTTNITNSTITGNSNRTIQNDFGTLTMTNCTVSGNTSGPGIYNGQFGGTASLYNCTITGNINDIGSGIYNTAGSFYIKNTIVAGNIQTITGFYEPDIVGNVISGGYNLIGNIGSTLFTPATGDLVGTTASPINPLFDPIGLQDNGNTGGVQTIALLPGSPAIDQGSAVTGVTTDQRGFTRPVDIPSIANASGGNGSDIGAFEFVSPPGPTASVLSVNGPSTICNGSSANLIVTITGGTSPYTVVYTDGTNNFTVNTYISGSDIPVSPTLNTTYSLVSVTDADSNPGTDNSGTAAITVNPVPTLGQITTLPVCDGSNAIITLPGVGAGGLQVTVNYNIDNVIQTSVIAVINPDGSVTFNTRILTNAADNNKTLEVTNITFNGTGCTNIFHTRPGNGANVNAVTLSVNPLPTATISGTTAICNGQSTNLSIQFTGTAPFAYSINNGTTVVTTNNPETVSVSPSSTTGYSVTSLADANCTAITGNFAGIATVVVNSTPTVIAAPLSQTICSGSSITTIVLTGGVTGTVFNWTRDNTVSVTGIAASGAGDISGALTNTTAAPITVTFTIIPTANGCTGAAVTATVVVNPIPNAVATPSSQTICSGSSLTTIALTGGVSGTVYNWTRDNTVSLTGIGASGSGSISGTLTNTTITTQTVTFTIIPVANGCTGTSITATVIIKPTPTAVATPSSQTICSGSSITNILLTGSLSGTTYNWTRDNTVTCRDIAASGTGNICGTLTNTTSSPVLVTFTITSSFNGCTGTPITATVMVNPKTNISANPVNQSILTLSNASFSVTATGTSITYQWQISTNGGTSYNNLSNGGVYLGATNATLSLTAVPLAMNGYKYRCVVTGTCTKVTSSAALLIVNDPCQNPTSLTTTNITSSGARLNWSAVYDPVQWDVQYKTTNTGSVWKDVLLAGNQRSLILSSLLTNQNYNWHIRAKCGTNWLSYTGTVTFKTLITTKAAHIKTEVDSLNIKQIQTNESFQVFPNPTRGEFTLILQGEDNINAKAKIKLVDMVGKTLYVEDAEMVNGLLQKTILTPSSFANGIYVVMVIIDEKLYTKHLILDK